MTLAKSSMRIAERYLELVPDAALAARIFGGCGRSTTARVAAVLELVEAHELLDRHPVLQRRSGCATRTSTR